MKRLLSILILLAACVSSRADNIYGTLTITTNPVNSSTLTIDGLVFTWTNGVPVGAFQSQITNTLANNATNLLNTVGLQLPKLGVGVVLSNNILVFSGVGLTGSISTSTNWATLTFTTSTTAHGTNVSVPFSRWDAPTRTNVASQLVSDIDVNSTTAFSGGSATLANYVGLTNNQYNISGNKIFTGSMSGTVSNLTNGTWTNPSFTNGQNFGNPFRSPGVGTGSEQFGLGASAATLGVAFGDGATVSASGGVAIGNGAISTLGGDISIGVNSGADGGQAICIGTAAVASGGQSIAIGQTATSAGSSSVAIGYNSVASSGVNTTALGAGATTTTSNQVMLGTSSQFVQVPGYLLVSGGTQITGNVTNLNTVGTNTIKGQVIMPRFNNTSLANGANAAVSTGTNYFIKVSGPSASFSIAGLAGGADDRVVCIENSTGFQMTISNDSGTDPTAANRIYTGPNADFVTTNNPGFVTLKYDASVTHWKVVSHN